jgi:FMN reductase
MPEVPLNVLAVSGSLQRESVSRVVVNHVAKELQACGCVVDVLDLQQQPLPLFNPDTCEEVACYPDLQKRTERTDVFVLGTPDYHGTLSGALKNFLDFFWHEFAGKLFVTLVASHEKGLTVTDQLRTIARQCYAWSLPYGVSFAEGTDVKADGTISDGLKRRLDMVGRDARVYGKLLTDQRRADLACAEACFLARHRKR